MLRRNSHPWEHSVVEVAARLEVTAWPQHIDSWMKPYRTDTGMAAALVDGR
jgi:hypothetical protein